MWDREAEPGEKAEEGDKPREEEGGESVIGVELAVQPSLQSRRRTRDCLAQLKAAFVVMIYV